MLGWCQLLIAYCKYCVVVIQCVVRTERGRWDLDSNGENKREEKRRYDQHNFYIIDLQLLYMHIYTVFIIFCAFSFHWNQVLQLEMYFQNSFVSLWDELQTGI